MKLSAAALDLGDTCSLVLNLAWLWAPRCFALGPSCAHRAAAGCARRTHPRERAHACVEARGSVSFSYLMRTHGLHTEPYSPCVKGSTQTQNSPPEFASPCIMFTLNTERPKGSGPCKRSVAPAAAAAAKAAARYPRCIAQA